MSNQTFISIGPYRDVVHRHRVSFYSTLVTGLALTALALVWIPKKYTSSVLLEVWHADVQSNSVGAERQNASDDTHLESRLEALSEETITHAHLAELIANHGLYLSNGKRRPDAIQKMSDAITITIPDAVLQSASGAPNHWERKLPPDVVQISFEDRDPATAQAVTSDLGNVMIDEYRNELEHHNAETIKLLSSELDETKGKLAEVQGQIKVLKEKYRGSLPQDLDENVKALQALQLQLERPAQSADNKTDVAGAASPDSPKPNTPDAALAALQTKLVALRAQYSDEYPEVIDTKSQIAVLAEGNREIWPATSRCGAPRLGYRLDPKQIADYQRAIAETPAHEEAIAAVNRDYAILSSRYNDLNNLFFEARADQAVLERGQGERLQVLQPASLPSTPSFPKPPLVIGGGIAATLLIALAIPFALFYTDTSFKDSSDVRAEFADIDAIVVSRVPEVDRHHGNDAIKSVEAPLALLTHGVTGDSDATAPEESVNGIQTTADGESETTMALMEFRIRSRAVPQGLPSDIRRRPWWRLEKG